MFPNPWKRLADDWPGVPVRVADLGRRYAVTRWEPDGPVIYLHEDNHEVQARAALAHEIEHLERGAPCETLRAVIERRVIDATARWLLPDIGHVAAAMRAYDDDLLRVAHDLWVPKRILIDRIKGLSEEEWIVIDKRGEAVA